MERWRTKNLYSHAPISGEASILFLFFQACIIIHQSWPASVVLTQPLFYTLFHILLFVGSIGLKDDTHSTVQPKLGVLIRVYTLRVNFSILVLQQNLKPT